MRSIVPAQSDWSAVWQTTRRRPTGVLPGDGLWARASFIRSGDTSLAIVSLDVLGLFYEDVVRIREQIRGALGAGTHVLVASTHTHSSIDTLGIYGPDQTTSGINPAYQAFVLSQAAGAAIDAAAAAQDVTEVRFGSKVPGETVNEYDRSRHPGTFDDSVNVIQLRGASGAIGTIVNWASHPELIDSKSTSDPMIPASMRGAVMSSDYAHTLRTTVEAAGGGTTVYLNGPNGAVTGLAVAIVDPDTGTLFPKKSVKKAYHVGRRIGLTALDALAAPSALSVTAPTLAVRSEEMFLTVENAFILALKAAGVVDRPTYTAGVESPAGRDVKTEMLHARFGPAEFLTMPGELQPDLYTGVYQPMHERANPDVPPERAIEPQMTGDIHFVVGLGMDELGYFVSATDYVPPTLNPLYSNGVDRNGVSHYQETLSLGRDTARALSQQASRMLGHAPEPDYFAYPGGFLTANGVAHYNDAGSPVHGIWGDTSDSGRYEAREDAQVFVPVPSAAGSAYGYLDSQLRDAGKQLDARARGVWVDGDGDGGFDARRDPHLFFDTWMLGEGLLFKIPL
ncbi:MAG TPA: hypothetical protein VM841_11180 [Actinomycetota bacterium]|nr:hypothetical protein [Actinomycetota bacterium]